MPDVFAEIWVKCVQILFFTDPLVQPVDTIGMTEIMDPWSIPFAICCLRKIIPEFMKPAVDSRLAVMGSFAIREKRLPFRVGLSNLKLVL